MTSTATEKQISARLRDETRQEHEHAETRPFMHELLGGALSLDGYAAYLAQFVRIYHALEARPRQDSDPEMIHDTGLHRAELMEQDLAALGLNDWETSTTALPATEACVERLQETAAGSWVEHLAHHYVRYLGDLSGGRVIAAMLRRHYDAQDEQLRFFDFHQVGDHVAYKRRYREELDALPLSAEEADRVVAESQRAFAFNSAIFDELESAQA